MIFDVYYPFRDKEGNVKPGVKPTPCEWASIKNTLLPSYDVAQKIKLFREQGDAEAKKQLPAINFVGRSCKTRAARYMTPTQLIMVDLDHAPNPREAWDTIKAELQLTKGNKWVIENIMVVHITPSGKGLHIIFRAQEGMTTLQENMEWMNAECGLGRFGDFDAVTKDFARISFAFLPEDLLWESTVLYLNTAEWPTLLTNNEYDPDSDASTKKKDAKVTSDDKKYEGLTEEERQQRENEEYFKPDEVAKIQEMEYRGVRLDVIIAKYVEVYGRPSTGEVHNYYNDMVKNFRNCASNNKRALLYLLPRFGHSIAECEDQVKSICRVNTLSSLPKHFYFFLKDNGFYVPGENFRQGALKEYMMNDAATASVYLPPVFKELVGMMPKDFKVPAINALMPILGTLTSYVCAEYPYDKRMHTTSFFSIVYAPPGTGKGFVEHFIDLLFADLKFRDEVAQMREDLYLETISRKSQSEKSPKRPEISLRIIPPKNSEAEFLTKMRDNQGYHMFTYAAEMDSWAKGVKAAGGNKDDMIRIAWDNGEYGQQFKTAGTFKGTCRLFWNVLITGTLDQVEQYFKNVENGLVTRCSFTSIENQEFAPPPVMKSLTAKAKSVIRTFMQRCDDNTYKTPLTVDVIDLKGLDEAEFDKKCDWRYQFRDRKVVDMEWLMPTIEQFHKEQTARASLDVDYARDVFRRRVAVRGFRLGLICLCLYAAPKKSDLKRCAEFIRWWMNTDIESMLKLWGAKYNEQHDTTPNLTQRVVFDNLPEQFTKNDVYAICTKNHIKTPIKIIIHNWKKNGYVEKLTREEYRKKLKAKRHDKESE